jgi:rhodanese-related sulfurtransferase
VKRTAIQIALLVAIALVPAISWAIFDSRIPSWDDPPTDRGEVTLAAAQHWGENVIWVDARSRAKFESAHIPGALLLNFDEWDELLVPVLARYAPGKRIVVYCDAQTCQGSHMVADRIRREAKLTDVFVLRDGWRAWVQSKQPRSTTGPR